MANRLGRELAIRYKTDVGERWKGRIEAAEAHHSAASKNWKNLRDLLVSMDSRTQKWGASVAMGWATIKNLIGITYFKNPDPRIQPISGTVSKDFTRMLESVFRGIHAHVDTENTMRDALLWESFTGFGGIWTGFEQEDEIGAAPMMDELGEPMMDGMSGEPMMQDVAETVRQEVTQDLVDSYDLRFDPDGRRWDLKDHKFIMRRYWRTVQEILDDPDYTNKEMFEEWAKANRKAFMSAPDTLAWNERVSHAETDYRYLLVPVWEIWSRVEMQIVHIPCGALFDIGVFEWTPEWKKARKYPLTFVAFNRKPADANRLEGFYPIPSLELIQPQLENLNRLEALFLDTATLAIRKYLYVKGLLGSEEAARITDDDTNRDMIPVDLMEVAKALQGMGAPPGSEFWQSFDLRRLVHLLPQEDRSEASKHIEAIQHELNLIYQIIGQGPGDRGGLAEANSATEALNLAARFEQRIDERLQQVGKFYTELTAKMWIVLKDRQTLPIPYRLLVEDPQVEASWGQFEPWTMPSEMELVFDHVTGSSRSRNRAQELLERREILTLAMPVLANLGMTQQVLDLLQWSLEPGSLVLPDSLRTNETTEIARQLATLLYAVQQGALAADDPRVQNGLMNGLAKLASLILTPAQMQQVAGDVDNMMGAQQEAAGSAPGGAEGSITGGRGTASLPGPKSAGQMAAAEGAAGAVGGMM